MYHDLENEFLDLLEADQNDPQVAYALGLCYLRGEGTEQDGAKAEQWLRRAAEQGHPEAQALLSSCRSAAPQREAVTEETLPDWCAAAEDGDPEAQYQVAQYFQQSQLPGTEDDVARYLSMAVAQGHPRACLMLGLQLLPEHPEEALRHLRNAADCGLAEAMEQLGECYAQGLGVAPDPVQAEHWFCAKAQQGDGEAMLALARRYKLGNGVPRSLGRALSWLKRAQLAGVTDAQDRYYAEERAKQAEEEAAKRARNAPGRKRSGLRKRHGPLSSGHSRRRKRPGSGHSRKRKRPRRGHSRRPGHASRNCWKKRRPGTRGRNSRWASATTTGMAARSRPRRHLPGTKKPPSREICPHSSTCPGAIMTGPAPPRIRNRPCSGCASPPKAAMRMPRWS